MARKNTLKSHGYIPCTAMKDMATADKPYRNRTPFNLTTNELLKKLCAKGPEGCNETCGNWGICEYGRAIKERGKGMHVSATITLPNRDKIVRYFIDWDDLCDWVKRHHGHIKGIDAKLRKPDEIRQGKENTNEYYDD